jgi:AdoMet-dependent heme synthase
MSTLMEQINARAMALRIPLAVHMDLTWRCNERCIHCYLDHDDLGEMTFEEVTRVLSEMAAAGVFLLTFSGGEPLLRKDFFPLVRRARELTFNLKIKSNGILIKEKEAALLRELGVDSIQLSVYSHRPEVHDAITKVPGSLKRTVAAVRFLRSQGLRVSIADVLMVSNRADHHGVRALAQELGVGFTLDPTITPHINGDRSLLALNVKQRELRQVMRDESLVGSAAADEALPATVKAEELDAGVPCSAGHSFCYISPYGDVFPCVQFPLPSGSLRQQSFADIWNFSPQLEEVRAIRLKDLPVCVTCAHVASCSRCPGLAYMEGNMRGPSSADCQKSYARTGILSANMKAQNSSPVRRNGEFDRKTIRF